MPTLAAAYDEPFGNSSAIPTFFCLKMAREAGVKIMFAGDGGDELYGGNERYITEKFFTLYQQIPDPVRVAMDWSAETIPGFYPWRKVKNYVRKANQFPVDRFFPTSYIFEITPTNCCRKSLETQSIANFPLMSRGVIRASG